MNRSCKILTVYIRHKMFKKKKKGKLLDSRKEYLEDPNKNYKSQKKDDEICKMEIKGKTRDICRNAKTPDPTASRQQIYN